MAKKNEIAKADSAHLQPLENIENLIHVIPHAQRVEQRAVEIEYGSFACVGRVATHGLYASCGAHDCGCLIHQVDAYSSG